MLKPSANERIVGLEIRNPFNDKDALDDKLSILDIKARDRQGRQYNVEMQMLGTPVFLQRVLYYWARLYGDQLHEGFDYSVLQPTISISFVNAVLFPQVPDYHLDFRLRSSRHPQLVFSMQQAMHLIELPKFTRTTEGLTDALDAWCYFLVHGAELDTEKLPQALRSRAVPRAMEVLQMLTQSDLERERYEARLKAERDRYSFLKAAKEQGMSEGRAEGHAEGRAEGHAEGIAQGVLVGRIQLCQQLLKLPPTATEELYTLSLADLQARAEALEQQIGAGGS